LGFGSKLITKILIPSNSRELKVPLEPIAITYLLKNGLKLQVPKELYLKLAAMAALMLIKILLSNSEAG
jgi:hypothetical protein